MPDRRIDSTRRLRGAGVGSILAGVVLAGLSVVAPYLVAAGVVAVLGLVAWTLERRVGGSGSRRAVRFGTRPSLGVIAIGAIGLLEAAGLGFGIGPLLLAGLAIGAGLVDIVVGSVMAGLRRRHLAVLGDGETEGGQEAGDDGS